ncbi:hypothetical protein C8J57DRAFT_1240270 [Mycena rebaudengoi]|nr:hypothetical protein C8J57DRAFT_1240270 [Mycena rebaudengoi]
MSVDCGGDPERFTRDEIRLEEANSCGAKAISRKKNEEDICAYNSLEIAGAPKKLIKWHPYPSLSMLKSRRRRTKAPRACGNRSAAAQICDGGFQLKTSFRVGELTRDSPEGVAELVGGLKHLWKQKEAGKVGEVELVHRAKLWSYPGHRNRRKSDRKKGAEEGSAEEIQQESEGNQRGRHVEERQRSSRRFVYGRQLVQAVEVRWWQEAGSATHLTLVRRKPEGRGGQRVVGADFGVGRRAAGSGTPGGSAETSTAHSDGFLVPYNAVKKLKIDILSKSGEIFDANLSKILRLIGATSGLYYSQYGVRSTLRARARKNCILGVLSERFCDFWGTFENRLGDL